MNTIPVELVDLLTRDKSYKFLTETLGFTNLTTSDVDYAPLGMGGTNGGFTTLQSAAAFAIFGNKGKYYEPILFTEIYDQYDNLIISNKSSATIALSEDTAVIMNKLLQNVVYGAEGTGAAAQSFVPNMRLFAKTGTANSTNDIWFVGGSPYYVASSWCGYDELQQIDDSKRARKMWGAVMKEIHKNLKPISFPGSDSVQCRVYCSETGLLAREGCPVDGFGWYKTTSQKFCSTHEGDVLNITGESAAKKYIDEYKAIHNTVDQEQQDTENNTENNSSNNTSSNNTSSNNSQNTDSSQSSVPTD
jgi:penicillin-binding protein 1A